LSHELKEREREELKERERESQRERERERERERGTEKEIGGGTEIERERGREIRYRNSESPNPHARIISRSFLGLAERSNSQSNVSKVRLNVCMIYFVNL
jgi:hypothetical protein